MRLYTRAVGYIVGLPDQDQREEFLELIAEGKTRQEAAELVGSTATRFRALINGKHPDAQAFAERYMEILAEVGNAPSPLAQKIRELEQVQLAHRIFDEFIMRAMDAERGRSGASNRMLHNLALLNVESFRPLLEARTRHIHEGAVGVFAMPKIDTDLWSIDEHREFVLLRKRMNELIAKAAPQHVDMLQIEANGNGDGEFVDAEAVEVA